MKTYKRDKNRDKDKVKLDIEATNKILREDIYDVLVSEKKRDKAEEALEEFLRALDPEKISNYIERESIDKIVSKVKSDIDSYGIEWEK